MDYGLAVSRVVEGQLLNDREECNRGLTTSIHPGMESSDSLVGFPGKCPGIGGGTQEDDTNIHSVHYSSSDGSGGLAAHDANQMEFEGGEMVGLPFDVLFDPRP